MLKVSLYKNVKKNEAFYICGGCVATNPILKTDKLVKFAIQTEDNDVNNRQLPE